MNKITYRILAIVMAIAMVFGMTACGGNTDTPETTAAPTEAPTTKAVNVCETEGHAWVDATCEAPKTCSACGETEGEALAHTWVEANYQQPKTCSVCSATEGEAITAGFVTNGWEINVTEVGKEYDYTTSCYDDTTKTTTGKFHVNSYEVFASDDTHEAKEGYEWRTATIKILFNDENAQEYLALPYGGVQDYYILDTFETANEDGSFSYTVNWNGVNYTECQFFAYNEWSETNEGIWFTYTVEMLMPIGYDGITIIFGNGNHIIDENTTATEIYNHEDTLFFRMDDLK